MRSGFFIVRKHDLVLRPTCRFCNGYMWLISIEPDERPGHDQRTFRCDSCHTVERMVVHYQKTSPDNEKQSATAA